MSNQKHEQPNPVQNKQKLQTDDIERTIAYLKSVIPSSMAPEIGIICGSGLGGLAKILSGPLITVDYKDIPGFPRTTVVGHAGELIFGKLHGKNVICLKGRFHFYEGNNPSTIAVPVRAMAALGVKLLIVTNAAGGVNPKYNVGDVMMIKDQIGFIGLGGNHPLRGPNDDRFGPRFPPVVPFRKEFLQSLAETAKVIGFKANLHSGVYFGIAGPSYETPSEIDMIRILRGDAVGMSTVYEILAAAHCDLAVLGLSLITNRCTGLNDPVENRPSHEEVLAAVDASASELQALVSTFVARVDIKHLKTPHAATVFAQFPFKAKL